MTAASDVRDTVPAFLLDAVEKFRDHESFVFDGERETYAETLERSLEVARGLIGMGVRPGDRVGVVLHNTLDFVHVTFGCALAGAAAVLVNIRLAAPELAYIVSDSGMGLIVVDDIAAEHTDLPAKVVAALPGLDAVAYGERSGSAAAPDLFAAILLGDPRPGFLGREHLEAAAASVTREQVLQVADAVDPEDTFIMMYTSGTTAHPKGCHLPHRSILRTGKEAGRTAFELTAEDKLWNPLPMFHVSAQAPIAGVLDAGATYVSTVYFDVVAAVQQIVDEGATVLFPAYPTLTQPLLTQAGDPKSVYAKVRAVNTVGPPDLLRSYQEQFPDTTVHLTCYGSTELGGIATMGRLDDPLEVRLTSGRALPGVEIEIRDSATGEPVPAGTGGTIWSRGVNLFTRYHNDPEKTAETRDDDGWFDTGDLGKVDEDGNLTFLGRVKDMLKVGGENVASIEIETVLSQHPAVGIAAVIGRPDDKYVEVPVAFVELVPGQTATEQELIDHAAARLAKWKVPREVRFVTEWPMSTTKIQKFRLREQL